MIDADFLAFDDLLTWRRTINSEEFSIEMPLNEFVKLYNSKKIPTKTKKLTFDGMLTQDDLNQLINN